MLFPPGSGNLGMTAITVIGRCRDRVRGHLLIFHTACRMTVIAVTKGLLDRYSNQNEIARVASPLFPTDKGCAAAARRPGAPGAQAARHDREWSWRNGPASPAARCSSSRRAIHEVEIGLVFEAATLAGVSLFVPEASTSRAADRAGGGQDGAPAAFHPAAHGGGEG